jgi:hypothetical protein
MRMSSPFWRKVSGGGGREIFDAVWITVESPAGPSPEQIKGWAGRVGTSRGRAGLDSHLEDSHPHHEGMGSSVQNLRCPRMPGEVIPIRQKGPWPLERIQRRDAVVSLHHLSRLMSAAMTAGYAPILSRNSPFRGWHPRTMKMGSEGSRGQGIQGSSKILIYLGLTHTDTDTDTVFST